MQRFWHHDYLQLAEADENGHLGKAAPLLAYERRGEGQVALRRQFR